MAKQRVSAADLLDGDNALGEGEPLAPSKEEQSFDLMNDLAMETLPPEEQKARFIRKEMGVRYVQLSNDRRVKFTTIYIPAGQVESLTRVHPANTRNPNSVTAESCGDILPSIQNDGVVVDALATKGADGIYYIFDGQRRRFCAIYAKKGLLVSFTTEILTPAEAKEISHIFNLTKPNSLYDNGRYYQGQMDELGMTQAEYADFTGISAVQINYGLAAVKIPMFIYELFPSKTDIGRPTILLISRQYKNLTDEQKEALHQACSNHLQNNEITTDAAAATLLRKLLADITGKDDSHDHQATVTAGRFTVKTQGNGKLEVTLPKGLDAAKFIEMLKNLK